MLFHPALQIRSDPGIKRLVRAFKDVEIVFIHIDSIYYFLGVLNERGLIASHKHKKKNALMDVFFLCSGTGIYPYATAPGHEVPGG